MKMLSLISAAKVIMIILLVPVLLSTNASAQLVPEWIKNTAEFWANDQISDNEFLNAVKFLIENDILVLESVLQISEEKNSINYVTIPNGNSLQRNSGFYIPINLEIESGTTVVWKNDDSYAHTIQSQDEDGKPSGLFNSNVLQTNDTFEHQFTNTGEYYYYCTLHPWRVGIIMVR